MGKSNRVANSNTVARRNFLRTAGGGVTAALLSQMPGSIGSAFGQDKDIKWKTVINHRIGAGYSHRWPWFIEQVKTRTNGRLAIELTTVPELGLTGQELLRSMKSNLFDFADIVAGYVSGDFAAIEAPQLPGLFPDAALGHKAFDTLTAKVVAAREDVMGGKVLATLNYNPVYFFSKFELTRPEDLKGKKVRVFSAALTDFVSALGGEPVNLPPADLYVAMERGTIDAIITGPDQVEGQRLYEVCKFGANLALGNSPGFTVVSRKTWDRLPADLKKTLEDIAPEYSKRGWEAGEINTKSGLDLGVAKGMKILYAPKPEWHPTLARISREAVLPRWSKRAGPKATEDFNNILGPIAGMKI
jgi:TRAP-type C4-dicarboxylate transport system substrate-binding protein